jgi:hypothetical protein
MRKRNISPNHSGVPPVTPEAASVKSPQPRAIGHAVFWIALHMAASSCLVICDACRFAAPVQHKLTRLQMILNKLAVVKNAAAENAENSAKPLPALTVLSLQTAFSVASVVRDGRAVTLRIALQWLPVRQFTLRP